MIGILCEKPSAANNFAKALGGKSGTFNGEQYRIVNAAGHLYEWPDPEDMVSDDLKKRYHSWRVDYLPWIETDFQWHKVQTKNSAKLLNDIKKGLTGCDEICIATDVDPTGEGELLAWEILDGLKLKPKRFTRIYHEDEEVRSIQKAFKERKELQSIETDMDYVKADFRSKWDFCSMQWTRIAKKYGDGRAVLRQGRLKSAMVLLVGDALKALAEYKEVPFYQNRFKDENGIIYINKDEPTFPDPKQVPSIYKDSDVTVDSKSNKHAVPPRLLDLAALSARLAPRGYRAKEVLSAYQKMYEAHVVSYPRTEDHFISKEQFYELLPLADKIAAAVGVNSALLTHKVPRPSHVRTGGSHGANRPGSNVPANLNELKKYGRSAPAIYETLAKNYLAMLADDYIYEQQKGHIKDYPAFTGTANVPLKAGWKAIFDFDDEQEDVSRKGLGTHAEPFVYEGVNKRPPVPTMKWLMKQLEKHDVGTGATRTSIYADVTNEKSAYPLLKETKGKLSMTVYGNMSYQLLPGTHIGTLKITEQLQKEMRDISAHKRNPEDCLKEIRQMIIDDREKMKENSDHVIKEAVLLSKDGKSVVKEVPPELQPKEKYEGTWHDKKISFNREWSGYHFSDEECEKLCNGEEIVLHGVKGRKNSTYDVKGILAEQTYRGHKFIGFKKLEYVNDTPAENTAAVETEYLCPVCHQKLLLKDGRYGKYYDCPNKDFHISQNYLGHTFTNEELNTLLSGKETDYISMKSRHGKTFQAKLHIENGEMKFDFKPAARKRRKTA